MFYACVPIEQMTYSVLVAALLVVKEYCHAIMLDGA